MSAGLTESDTMFSVRETPWHGLGAVLPAAPRSIAEAIEASGLGWQVEKMPIAYTKEDEPQAVDSYEPVSGFYATVRKDTGTALGVVGERYRVVQNHEAFAFIDGLIGSSMNFETAGSLHGGRRVWVLATLPEHVEVGGDAVRRFVLLMNSHDASTALVAATTPVRVVCQNTLNWGLRAANHKLSIRHTDSVRHRLAEARRVLDLSINYYAQFKRIGDALAREPFSERQLDRVLARLYPSGPGDSRRVTKSRQSVREQITDLFLLGKTQGNAPRSKWAAANAVAEFEDWQRPSRSADKRFARTIAERSKKTKALELIAAA